MWGRGRGWQKVCRERELGAGKAAGLKGHDEVVGVPRAGLVPDARVEPVVRIAARGLVARAAIIVVTHPEIGRVPEGACPVIGAPILDGTLCEPGARKACGTPPWETQTVLPITLIVLAVWPSLERTGQT